MPRRLETREVLAHLDRMDPAGLDDAGRGGLRPPGGLRPRGRPRSSWKASCFAAAAGIVGLTLLISTMWLPRGNDAEDFFTGGAPWDPTTLPAPGGGSWAGPIAASGRSILVGGGVDGGGTPVVWTSDESGWSMHTLPLGEEETSGEVIDVEVSPDLGYLAVGSVTIPADRRSGEIWHSGDGRAWRSLGLEVENVATRRVNAVTALPEGGFVAVGTGSASGDISARGVQDGMFPIVWRSDDAAHWNPVFVGREHGPPGTRTAFDDVAVLSNGDLLAIGCFGNSHGASWVSSDRGTTWKLVPVESSPELERVVALQDGRAVALPSLAGLKGRPAALVFEGAWTEIPGSVPEGTRYSAIASAPDPGVVIGYTRGDRIGMSVIEEDQSAFSAQVETECAAPCAVNGLTLLSSAPIGAGSAGGRATIWGAP